jgi:hypothetical protein
MENQRRVRAYVVTAKMLEILLFEGAMARCMSGVPPEAKMLGLVADYRRDAVILTFEHPTFAPVPDGVESPMLFASFEIVEDPGAAGRDFVYEQLGWGIRKTRDHGSGGSHG